MSHLRLQIKQLQQYVPITKAALTGPDHYKKIGKKSIA
jgi:hypothetical protein